MKKRSLQLAATALGVASLCLARPVQAAPQGANSTTIDVWPGPMPGVAPMEERAKQKEGSIETKDAHNAPDTVVFNVTHPTLEVVRPTGKSNGAALVIAPGGGFRVLAYANEGTRVATWAASHGFTAFILKYRLNPMPNDLATRGLGTGRGAPGAGGAPAPAGARGPAGALPPGAPQGMPAIGPFEQDAIADGIQALKVVRSHAKEYGVDPARVGFVGFSAGGVVSGRAAIAPAPEDRPNFVGVIYSGISGEVPKGAPPAFFAAAADDPLSSRMPGDFARWLAAGSPAEIHVYATGQHGFGTVKQGLPVDGWLDAFYMWMVQQGMTKAALK
jgi:acetyl esterase/lipase